MMAEINFTPEQRLAIDTEGCDVLVSAAAGSGKTAVLTRRVLNKIIDTSKKTDITDFLVVTFTVSAAGDLKRKLSEGIREEMRREGADAKRLRRQLLSLSYAKIATIDSFCLFIVRDCLDLLSLPVGMTLGDEKEMSALAAEIMEECVENAFCESEQNDGFALLVETFSNARGDAALVPSLLSIYSKIINYPEPLSLFNEYIEECDTALLNRADLSFFKTPFGKGLYEDISEKLSQAEEWLKSAEKLCELDEDAYAKYLPVIESDLEFLCALEDDFKTSYECFANKLTLFSPQNIPAIRGRAQDELLVKIKSLRAEAKDTVAGFKKTYLVKDERELFLQLELHSKILGAIYSILCAFHERFMKEKQRRKIMSFSDMSHYAFKALIKEGSYSRRTGEFEKTPYAEELTSRFREILIDEYQDVNALQDIIFRAVSNSKNRFMVGDIKQSIYGFRGAVPEIFSHLRDTFKPHGGIDDKGEEPKSVFLQNNYRSDSKILEFSNKLFSALMNWESEKYLKKDHLVFSKKEDKLYPVELFVFHKNFKSEDWEKEQEAVFVSNKIVELVTNGECDFSDIAVLARNTATLEKIKKALDRAQVPCEATGQANLFDSYEVLTAISFLKAVANPTDDVSLASAMTSLPFSFVPDELLKIRGFEKKRDFYFALVKAGEENSPLGEKCREFLTFLSSLSEFSEENTPDRVVWRILEDTGLLTNVEKLGEPKERRQNLITLYSLSRSLCSKEKGSLSALVDKLDTLARDGKIKTSKNAPSNAVKLMTFHGSKGLQYPVVFTAGLGSEINRQDTHEKIVFSPFGPTFNLPWSEANTKLVSYLRMSAARLVEKGLIDEELRCLYVALTRAETRLFVTAEADTKSLLKACELSSLSQKSFSYSVKHASTLMSFLAIALKDTPEFVKGLNSEEKTAHFSSDSLSVTFVRGDGPVSEEYYSEKEKEEKNLTLTPDTLAFALKDLEVSEIGSVPYKISVSRLKRGLLDEGEEEEALPIKAPRFISPDAHKTPALKGTSMHTFMQFCSFDLFSEKDVEAEADRLVREGFITEEHRENLDIKKLYSLISSSIFDEIRKSEEVAREKRYTVSVNIQTLAGGEKYPYDDKLLVQGVVDCYFKNESGTYTLIDFKTDRVSEENGEETLLSRHAAQLILYARALSEILPEKIEKILIYSFSLSRFIEVKQDLNFQQKVL